jgi:hypothetical protein
MLQNRVVAVAMSTFLKTRDDHRHCEELRPILEVTKYAKSSTAIAHIERDLEDIDSTFEKIKSDITKNISDIDKQKRIFLSGIVISFTPMNVWRSLAYFFILFTSCRILSK